MRCSTDRNPSHTYAAGTYTVSLTVTDDGGAIGSTSQNVTVSDGSTGETMHVSAIDMRDSTAGPNYFIYTSVTIVGTEGSVSDATVYLTTMLPDGSTTSGSGTTGSDGSVTFKLKSRQTGTYTSVVDDVTHASLTYDSGADEETIGSVLVP